MNLEKTGLFLKKSREEKELEVIEVSKRFNVSVEEVLKWESGKSLPNTLELPMLCKMYNITVDELYAGEKRDKKITKKRADILVMFSSVMILAAAMSYFLLRTIDLEVSILSAIMFVSIGVLTLLYVGLKTE